jgi:hypothetical protein
VTDSSADRDAHAAERASAAYQAQLQELGALTFGFLDAVRAGWLAATRDPASPQWLFWRFVDDLIASAVGIASLVRDGLDRPARRELRFMLELVIRNLYVDTVIASPATPLTTRLAYVEHKLGHEDVGLLVQLPLQHYLVDPDEFKQATRRLYGELSTFAHPSPEQMKMRLDEAARGVYIGFETAAEFASFTDLLRRAYDILLVFVFEAIGPSSTGDIYVHILDERTQWPFHRTRYVPEVGRAFDYKLEGRKKAT